MRRAGLAACLMLGAALAQCDKAPPKAQDAGRAAAPAAPPPTAFGLTLAFTAKAAARLKPADVFSVSARYYGLPRPDTQGQTNKDGVIDIGAADATAVPVDKPKSLNGQTWPKTAAVSFRAPDSALDRLRLIAGAKPLVQVEVKPRDGVGCDVFQDYVATAQSRPVTLICDVQ
jgi:hypothetical protein